MEQEADLTPKPQSSSHFWISESQFFSSVLLSSPLLVPDSPVVQQEELSLELYDCDGVHSGALRVQWRTGDVGVIDLKPLLSTCKLDNGLRHGHLVVKSSGDFRHLVRYQGEGGIGIVNALPNISTRAGLFVPIRCTSKHQHLAACVNLSDEAGTVTVRLMFENRSPEIQVAVPAHGCVIVPVEEDFSLRFNAQADQGPVMAGYIRCATRHTGAFGIQILERIVDPSEGANGTKGDSYRVLV